jgi:cytoskeletal protein CcmA (bactofilin family)
MSKTRLGIIAFLVLFGGFFAYQAKAFTAENKDSVYVAKEEIIGSNFFAAGSSITIDGKVQGDVYCAGRSIIINGFVDGDVICAGQSITINGEVRGNVRLIGSSVTINGKVARNAMAAGSDINLGSKGEVGWDMLFAGSFMDIRGTVKRDLEGAGQKMVLGGIVGRDTTLFSGNDTKSGKETSDQEKNSTITIAKTAVINGNLSYTAPYDAMIEEGSMIKGSKTRHDPIIGNHNNGREAVVGWLWLRVIAIFSALLIGLILVSWLRRPLEDISLRMFKKPYVTFGYGLLFIFVTPLVCILLLMTIIGIPLALILLGVWLITLFIAKIITAIILGQEIMKRRQVTEVSKHSLIIAMVIGIIVSYILFSIPVIGWMLSMIATILGVGAIWIYGREKSTRSQL